MMLHVAVVQVEEFRLLGFLDMSSDSGKYSTTFMHALCRSTINSNENCTVYIMTTNPQRFVYIVRLCVLIC